MSKNLITPKQEPMAPNAVRDVLLDAQRQIQARQQQLNFVAPATSAQQRLAELKGRIASQIGQFLPTTMEDRPVHVTIDKEGRTIDSHTGEVLQLLNRAPTLKANLRVQKKDIKQERPKLKQEKDVAIEYPGMDASAQHFDARIGTHPALRNSRRAFSFNQQGKYEDIANRQRAKAKLEILLSDIREKSKTTGIAVENKATIIQPKKFFSELDVPEIEWWDKIILQQENYSAVSQDVNLAAMLTGITQLIEHPIQLKAPYEPNKPVLVPIHLTKREQKKLRRQNRAEVLKEQQEKIRLGLLPPPEPKVKISTFMNILGETAVPDPTRVEQYVRNQMAERVKTHQDTNAARKLSAEQRREKKTKRATEDTATGVHASVYRVRHLNDAAKRFKVETNCKQLQMTGCVILCKDVNIIVVEGGPKQQKKFRRLMLHRIKWGSSGKGHAEDDESEENGQEKNKCVLLWQGTVKDRSFGEIKFKSCPTENFAREHFRRHGVEHYWDIGHNDTVLDASTY